MARFLAKVIITLESGIMKDVFHQSLREISAHNKSNLLEMIGVDPVIFRTETNSSSVDLQIWITTITGSTINRLVVPLYYTGARKYLFMCSSKNAVNFVMDTIEFASQQFNALNEIIILTPKKGSEIKQSKLKRDITRSFEEKTLANFSFFQWEKPADLVVLFEKIVNDLVTTSSQEVGYAPVGFDLTVVEKIVKRQGFEVNQKHEVIVPKDKYIFRLNLELNEVFAEMRDCSTCDKDCKVSKKLCIQISDKGFANIAGLGDLRMLSILFAIEDGSIFKLKGKKSQEDIGNQLKELRKTFKKKCNKE
ncbi:MAG: hypothetical protein ACTSQK_08410 [Candidatus Heimdallarchaeota archaeon]